MDEKMIKEYISYDFDDEDDGEKSISIYGKNFEMLMEKCFEYSTCFSMIFRPANDPITFPAEITHDNTYDYTEYDKYIIKSGKTNKWPGSPGAACGGIIRYYKCCEDTLNMILSISDTIFDFAYWWDNLNPEDPCFYRADGTVLLASEIHEGKCYLFPKDSEDFDEIFNTIKWYQHECTTSNYNKYYNDLAVFMTKEDFMK